VESTVLIVIWGIWIYQYWLGFPVHGIPLYLHKDIHDGGVDGCPIVVSERFLVFALVLHLLLPGLAYVLLFEDPFSSSDARNWKGESTRIPVVPGAFPLG
jgi:hypothetical protein